MTVGHLTLGIGKVHTVDRQERPDVMHAPSLRSFKRVVAYDDPLCARTRPYLDSLRRHQSETKTYDCS